MIYVEHKWSRVSNINCIFILFHFSHILLLYFGLVSRTHEQTRWRFHPIFNYIHMRIHKLFIIDHTDRIDDQNALPWGVRSKNSVHQLGSIRHWFPVLEPSLEMSFPRHEYLRRKREKERERKKKKNALSGKFLSRVECKRWVRRRKCISRKIGKTKRPKPRTTLPRLTPFTRSHEYEGGSIS